MAAPPLLAEIGFDSAEPLGAPVRVSIPHGAYGAELIAKLKALGANVTEVPVEVADGLRGTLATVAIDPKTGKRTTVELPGVMVFGEAE